MDRKNRVWIGHLNHGVSVYNGQKWQNYEVVAGLSTQVSLSGPLGERVFDIAVCPADGDVWIASSAGLARYSESRDDWRYYTRADGLPSDQASALAFDAAGTLFVGTQCDGLAIARPADDYASWKQITGPDKLPTVVRGEGLPTNLINDVLIARDGAVWVATTTGIAVSRDGGESFVFGRGADWADKVRGLYGGPPAGWKQEPGALYLEDYINCLAEDASGRIWIGYRQKGWESIDAKTFARDSMSGSKHSEYVNAILAGRLGVFVGMYGEKESFATAAKTTPAALPAVAAAANPLLPAGAKPPTVEELEAMVERIKALPQSDAVAAYLGEDWMTQGDWVGRYGAEHAVLCATSSPYDDVFPTGMNYKVQKVLGPNHQKDDAVRHWIHWMQTTDRRCLFHPAFNYRRQAEWDDHGESYPLWHDGPDIWIGIDVPAGVHRISLYFVNKDGHQGLNRLRDYLIELRFPRSGESASRARVHAHARVRGFRGGAYVTFLTNNAGRMYLRLARRNSYNTMVSGVFIDRVDRGRLGRESAQAAPMSGNDCQEELLPARWYEAVIVKGFLDATARAEIR